MSTKMQFQELAREMAVVSAEWKTMKQVPPPQYFGEKLQAYSAALRNLAEGMGESAVAAPQALTRINGKDQTAHDKIEALDAVVDELRAQSDLHDAALGDVTDLRKRVDALEKAAGLFDALEKAAGLSRS